MQNNKLNNIVHEINEFIKLKVGLLLNDLLVQSNEYEETKTQILKLPFIQQIINEMANKQNNENEVIYQEQPIFIKIEPCDLTDDIKDKFFETDPYDLYDAERERIYYERENISLNIEDPHVDNILSNDTLNMHTINIEISDTEDSDDVKDEQEVVNEIDTEEQEEHVVDETASEEESEDEVEVELVIEEQDENDELVVEEEDQEEVDELEEEQEESDELMEEEEELVDEEEEVVDELDVEEEEEGVFEIEINGTTYFTDNEKNGTIYSIDENGDPDEEIGTFVNGNPIFTNKQ